MMDEYAAASTNRPVDGKGRIMADALTDREIAEETLLTMRALADVLEAVGQSPMAAAMMPGIASLKRK